MLARLDYVRDRLRSSFWLIPALMAVSSIIAALFLLWLDQSSLGSAISGWSAPYAVSAAGARLVLSTIAGSMITVASLVFSMTLIALTLAASSIGARMLDHYIANRVNQVALGLFLSTFIYSLILLRAVNGGNEDFFVPNLAVTVAMLFAIFSFGWLIYFIHDLATSIQVDNAVAQIGAELIRAIERHADGQDDQDKHSADTQRSEQIRHDVPRKIITVGRFGYLQTIDADKLVALASENDVIIEMRQRPGDFAIASTELACVAGATDREDQLEEGVLGSVVYGPKRTAAQDLCFSIRLLVEVAARALSTGVNDFYTAIACIDQLSNALATILRKGLPSAHRKDEDDQLRVVLCSLGFGDLLDRAFDPIRQSAGGEVAVLVRLLESLTALATLAQSLEQRHCIRDHGNRILISAKRQVHDRIDFEVVAAQYNKLQTALGSVG